MFDIGWSELVVIGVVALIAIGPKELPAVPPADDLTARTVCGSMTLAAVRAEPQKAEEKLKRFLEIGCEVGSGAKLWTEAPARR